MEDLTKDGAEGDDNKNAPRKQQPKRQRLPDSLPRVDVRHDLDSHACPGCSGQRAARFCTLIESAKLNGVDPHAYLTHIFERLPSAKAVDLDSLLPWNFAPQPAADIALG